MKTRNLFRQAAVAAAVMAACTVASAGTLSGTTTFATELFGTGSSALVVQPTALTYTFSTPGGIVLNVNGSVYITYRLGNGATFAALPLAAEFGGTVVTGLGLTQTVVGRSTDNTTAVVRLQNLTAGNVTIGVGSTLVYTPPVGALTVGTSAGSIQMSAGASVTAITTAPNTGTAIASDIDTPSVSNYQWTTTAEAVTGTIAASSSFAVAGAAPTAETARIDLNPSGFNPGTRFTTPGAGTSNVNNGTKINLGSVTFTDVATTQQDVTSGTDYTIATTTPATPLNGTVTGTFKASSVLTLDTAATCAGGGGLFATGTLNGTNTTFTFTNVTRPTAGTAYYFCYETATGPTVQIPISQPTASLSLSKTRTTDSTDSASGSLYNMQQNGSTVIMRTYVPAARAGQYVVAHITNTGSIAAQLSVQVLREDGTTSTPALIGTTIQPGGKIRLNQAAIEAVIGAQTATARPRLRFTAPTNGLELQTIFNNDAAALTNLSGVE